MPKGNYRGGYAYIGTCKQCGGEFLSRNKQPFCSQECRGLSMRGSRIERICLNCGQIITSPYATKYCSHSCACKALHKKGVITTPRMAANEVLLNSNNPHYSQDATGQWWYQPFGTKEHGRTRAYIKICKRCEGQFLASIFHRKNVDYCSHSCSSRASCEVNPERFRGKRNANWNGGRRKLKTGYIEVWSPEDAQRLRPGTKKPYVLEHRLVMAKLLGRDLLPTERVHHKGIRYNGIKNRSDNLEDNLELWVIPHPPGVRENEQKHCPTCTCFEN